MLQSELRSPPDVMSRGLYLLWFRHAVSLLSSCFLSSAVHEKWGFCGQEAEIDASVHEKGRFCGLKRFPIESGLTIRQRE